MARLAEGGPSLIVDRRAEAEEIKAWYRERLASTVPPKGLAYDPVRIGPTWQWTPEGGWYLPEFTLGWEWLAWAGLWLRGPHGDPWAYTMEQARIVLWFGAVEPGGSFLADHYVLQRLKGWGKDPLAATLAVLNMVGPVVPTWQGDRLVGVEEPNAWVQILAVSKEQTKNTMRLFPNLIPQETREFFGMQVGRENLWALGDTRMAEAVTSNPNSIEGGRPTLLIESETQNWVESNGGHDMIAAIDGNAGKAEITRPARQLMILNAYVPGRDSVAQRTREGWEESQGPDARTQEFGMIYDSLEAPPKAPLTADAIPLVLEGVRGDAEWLNMSRIRKTILNPRNQPSESRRKWYNQIQGDADSWLLPSEIDWLIDREKVLDPADEVVLFFDGGKTDDATGVIYCRVLDGHCGVVGMWQRPPKSRIGEWVAPRAEVDQEVRAFLDSHNVVALFADPSHAVEDETQLGFWDTIIDGWHRDYHDRLRLWAVTGRGQGHATQFDMSNPALLKEFVAHVAVVTQEFTGKHSGRPFTWDGDIRLRRHLLNARRVPSKYGLSLGKANRKSQKKIDLAVCLVGARMVRRKYLMSNGKKRRKRGSVG